MWVTKHSKIYWYTHFPCLLLLFGVGGWVRIKLLTSNARHFFPCTPLFMLHAFHTYIYTSQLWHLQMSKLPKFYRDKNLKYDALPLKGVLWCVRFPHCHLSEKRQLQQHFLHCSFWKSPLGCPSEEKQSQPVASSGKPLGHSLTDLCPGSKNYTPERDAGGTNDQFGTGVDVHLSDHLSAGLHDHSYLPHQVRGTFLTEWPPLISNHVTM